MHDHEISASIAWDDEDPPSLLRRTLIYLDGDDAFANPYIEMPVFVGVLRHLFVSTLDEVTEADEKSAPYSHMVKDVLSLACQLMTTARGNE